MQSLRVLMPAYLIPDGSVVTKKTGTKQYTLRQTIVIYGIEKEKREIHGTDGVRFLVSPNGDINAVEPTTQLLVELDRQEIMTLLDEE